MNVLIACEESQEVCKAFRAKGHRAFSCDIQECSGGHPEWHIMDDVLPLLNGRTSFTTMDGQEHQIDDRWDLIIAHPPCTHLAVSGARHFAAKREDGRQREAIEFFCQFLEADCDKIVVENPVCIISGSYLKEHFPDLAEKYNLPKKPAQMIQPYEFGERARKKTCLWEKEFNLLSQLKLQIAVLLLEMVAQSMLLLIRLTMKMVRRLGGVIHELRKLVVKLFLELRKQWQNSGVNYEFTKFSRSNY